MNNTFLNPSLEALVTEIIAVNLAWKEAVEVGDHLSAIALSLAQLKTRLQVRLLHQYAPDRVYLQLDTENQGLEGEALYGLILRQPIANYWNAAHLPVRIAQKMLSSEELQQFIN